MNILLRMQIWIKVIMSFLLSMRGCQKAKFYTCKETVEYIVDKKVSLIRFGDGEFNIMRGESISYQGYSKALGAGLKALVRDFKEKQTPYLVCMPAYFLSVKGMKLLKKRVYIACWSRARRMFNKDYDYDVTYGDSFLFSQGNEAIYSDIWKNENQVVFVHHDELYAKKFFDRYNIRYKFVKVPSVDAFTHKESIVRNIEKSIENLSNKKTCILISAGPCAKLLVKELAEKGYWAIDTGHCWDAPLHSIPSK
ncbi:hypothetical protein CS063_11800 [Sporanaerobium hydrogeniformans]|uniref:Uncharacterized protein n=1 Tax=Sporanaerobium hydrogeniformans TaxID=3072179 RepID=A0AC61DA92_9FIRM|nr:GT-D fold domain-containing glycosyltransferase [Sporanaerobium hydrogeniformans]PHV70154.1 hypothetical protein CS063_11800 [Sporanaerobium hydrogeniformans]